MNIQLGIFNVEIPKKDYLWLKKMDSNTIDAQESDYLYIQTSQLPDSGKGLFTAIAIYKDEIVAIFKGEILSDIEAAKRVKNNIDQYFMNLLNGTILDCKNTDCYAKYANDATGFSIPKLRDSFKNNTKISLDENGNVCLIAIRKIKSGEEIFCDYGKRYWKKHH